MESTKIQINSNNHPLSTYKNDKGDVFIVNYCSNADFPPLSLCELWFIKAPPFNIVEKNIHFIECNMNKLNEKRDEIILKLQLHVVYNSKIYASVSNTIVTDKVKGYCVVTKSQYNKIFNKDFEQSEMENLINIVKNEIEPYCKWLNGEVYEGSLYDKNGDLLCTYSNIYSINDVLYELGNNFKQVEFQFYNLIVI